MYLNKILFSLIEFLVNVTSFIDVKLAGLAYFKFVVSNKNLIDEKSKEIPEGRLCII